MQDRVRNFFKKTGSVLLIGAVVFLFSGCATSKESPRLVDDPDAKQESNIPWNKQEKWEQGQELSQIQGASSSDSR